MALPNWQPLTSLSCSLMSTGRAIFFFLAPDVRAETAMAGVGSQGPIASVTLAAVNLQPSTLATRILVRANGPAGR